MGLTAPLTAQQAYDATNPDPKAYNLPPDHTEEQLQAAREKAANNILLGSRANQAYWDSRQELEALKAQADGHGVVTLGEDPSGSTAPGEAIEGTSEDIPENQGELAAPGSSETEKLRAQLREAGITPAA